MRMSAALAPLAVVAVTFAACGVASDPEGVQLPPPTDTIGAGSPDGGSGAANTTTDPADPGAADQPGTDQPTGDQPGTPPAAATPVGAIERADVLVPGFVTVAGWANDMAGTGPTPVTAWLDLDPVATVRAGDPWSSAAPESIASGFAFDLAVPPGDHVVCVTIAPDRYEPLDCIEIAGPAAVAPVDYRTVYLTALTPNADGRVTVRGVDNQADPDVPSQLPVASSRGIVTAAGGDQPIAEIDVVGQAFRFDVADLGPGAWAVCAAPEGVTVERRVPAPSAADGCGTIVVGDTHVGTTGLVIAVQPVGPTPDHPLFLMERDGGVSVVLRDGSTMWFFGDSMERRADGSLRYFVNNTAVWAAPGEPTVTRDAVSASGAPYLFAVAPPNTCDDSVFSKGALWPESAAAIPQDDGTDRVVVVMSKVCVGRTWLDIDLVGFAIAEYVYDPSAPPANEPVEGHITQPDLAPVGAGYGRAMLLEPDGYLYGYQCGSYQDAAWGPCRVGRVPAEQVADPAAWRYWTGGDWTDPASWVAERAAAAAMDVPDPGSNTLPVASFGVVHDTSQDAYFMVYSPWPAFCSELDVRVAATPVGPWSEPVPITLPGCSEEVGGLAGHCYAATPQMEVCGPEELGGGYFDLLTDTGLGRYFTFVVPFVVTHAAG